MPNPVNLLFSELLVCHKDAIFSYDDVFRGLIYTVLDNFSDLVEMNHIRDWDSLTQGMSGDRKQLFRKKLDKFVWRVFHRLTPAVEAKDFSDIDVQLTLLTEYMRNCPTRVTSQQVADACMEVLLKIKVSFSVGCYRYLLVCPYLNSKMFEFWSGTIHPLFLCLNYFIFFAVN